MSPVFPTHLHGYLSDTVLIATHSIHDGCFDKTVVYICAHNNEGAMGVIVNMPLNELGVHALLEELDISMLDGIPDKPIYFGGPVDTNQGFILHSQDAEYQGTLKHLSGISFSTGVPLLQDLAKGCGPSDYIIALGYAGWAAGQLEKELETGSWLVAPASPQLLFHTPSGKQWNAAAASLGVDLDRLSSSVGHA